MFWTYFELQFFFYHIRSLNPVFTGFRAWQCSFVNLKCHQSYFNPLNLSTDKREACKLEESVITIDPYRMVKFIIFCSSCFSYNRCEQNYPASKRHTDLFTGNFHYLRLVSSTFGVEKELFDKLMLIQIIKRRVHPSF